MNHVRAAVGLVIVVLVLVLAVAAVIQPLLPWLLALFFLASVLHVIVRGR